MGLKSKHVALDETTLRSIEKNVELVKNHFSEQLEVELDFNSESIEWIDGYINRNREKLDSDTVDNLSNIFGSFLGATAIHVYSGAWSLNDGNLGIYFEDSNSWAFPFAKTQKQFRNGPEDSIYSFFSLIPKLLDGSLSRKN